MGEKFNPNEKSKFIQYLDANNLYGWAMSLPLPARGFKWMTDLKNWREFYNQEGKGCSLEFDLEYPKKLHDLHNEYPLAPERIEINKVEKLIPNLIKRNMFFITKI